MVIVVLLLVGWLAWKTILTANKVPTVDSSAPASG